MIECLTQPERARLEEVRIADPLVDAVLRQLERISRSKTFKRAQRKTLNFLSFVVAKKLLGDENQIKQTSIAIRVFGESADFDALESSKVRVSGVALRRRLGLYYAREGRDDPIEIAIPLATYVPEFGDRRIGIAVTTFENWHPAADQAHLCCTLADDIAYLLNQVQRVHAVRTTGAESDARVRYVLRGSLEPRKDSLRLNVSLSDVSANDILHGRSFKGRRTDALQLTRDIVNTFLGVLQNRDDERESVTSETRAFPQWSSLTPRRPEHRRGQFRNHRAASSNDQEATTGRTRSTLATSRPGGP